jgi:hypothetical protein
MNDKERPPAPTATGEDSWGDAASLRSTLLAAASGARHLGEISKSLERIASALERLAPKSP